MGEAKRRKSSILGTGGQPLETAVPMSRPDAAIAQMKATVMVAPAAEDPDTAAFMRDLQAVLNWIDHLESSDTGETPIALNA